MDQQTYSKLPRNVQKWISDNLIRLPRNYSWIDVVDAINDDFNLRESQKELLTKDLMPEYIKIKRRRSQVTIICATVFIILIMVFGLLNQYNVIP